MDKRRTDRRSFLVDLLSSAAGVWASVTGLGLLLPRRAAADVLDGCEDATDLQAKDNKKKPGVRKPKYGGPRPTKYGGKPPPGAKKYGGPPPDKPEPPGKKYGGPPPPRKYGGKPPRKTKYGGRKPRPKYGGRPRN